MNGMGRKYMVMKALSRMEDPAGNSYQLPAGEYVVPVFDSEQEAEKCSENGKYAVLPIEVKQKS